MKESMRFIPTRFDKNNKIVFARQQLQFIRNFSIAEANISKQVHLYKGNGFELKHVNYILPVKFDMMYFDFFNTQVVDDFLNSNYFHIKGLIDVSKMERYDEKNIINHSICKNKFIIEGTKGVGKSCLIHEAIDNGIICQDRDMQVVSNDKYNNLPIAIKVRDCYERIHRDNDEYLLIIKNTDTNELLRRINERNINQEKDSTTEYYKDYSKLNIYIERYNLLEKFMKENQLYDNKIDIIDCTGLDKNEQQKKLFKYIYSK